MSILLPCFNEEDGVGPFLNQLRLHAEHWTFPYEVIAIDDGSRDSTWTILCSVQWRQLRCLRLATNVGHQRALEVGFAECSGSVVVTMDADGQHPPTAIDEMIELAQRDNLDVVYGIPRSRELNGLGKRWSGIAYYRLMRFLSGVPIVDSAADFRLVSGRVVEILRGRPSPIIYRLLIPSLGFPSGQIKYELGVRQYGDTKYSPIKMMRLAIDSVIQFSTRPLRFITWLGLSIFFLAMLWILWVLVAFFTGQTVAGWASQMSVTLALGGMIMLCLGVVGQYLGAVIESTRGVTRSVVLERNEFSQET